MSGCLSKEVKITSWQERQKDKTNTEKNVHSALYLNNTNISIITLRRRSAITLWNKNIFLVIIFGPLWSCRFIHYLLVIQSIFSGNYVVLHQKVSQFLPRLFPYIGIKACVMISALLFSRFFVCCSIRRSLGNRFPNLLHV